MKKRLPHRIGKIVSWTLGILILLIILLPFALYIPWVQEKAKDIACHYVKEKTGMDLSIGRILIKFPLDLSLDDMVLLDQKGDTMVAAKNFTADVAFKPLFDKRFEIDGAELVEGKYRMVSEDSSMVLRADVRHCKFTGTDIDLENNKINVLDGELTGGKVHLAMFPYKKIEEPDSTESDEKSKPWLIAAKHLTLNDVDYTMEMVPTIDNLTTHLARAELRNGVVDTGAHSVDVNYLSIDSVDCKYVYPSKEWADRFNREHPVPPEKDDPHKDTIPWTIKGDSLRLNGGHAIYALRDKRPGRCLDTDYIEVSDLNFGVNDFYNRGPIVMVPLQYLTAKERSGLEITEAHGTAKVNSQDIQAENFVLKTKNSSFEIDGRVDQSMFSGDGHNGSVKLKTNSSVDLRELGTALPSLASVTKAIPSRYPVKVKGTFEGNTRDIDIKDGSLEIPGHIKAKMGGNIKNITDPKKINANVNFDADVDNVEFAKKEFLSKDVQKQFNLQPMKLKGNVQYKPDQIGGDIDMRLKSGGSLVGNGSYNLKSENYTIDATAKSFPVKKIVPAVDINNVTAHIKGSGHGFDFLGKNTAVNAQVQLTDLDYAGKHYRNLDADVKLNGQNFDAKVNAHNRGTLAAKGSYDLKRNKYDIDADLNNFAVNEFSDNFVPDLGIGRVTAKVKAKGENFDFLKSNTWVDADVDLTSIEYKNQVFTDLKGNVKLDGNQFDGRIDSKIPNCDAYADFSGSVNGNIYTIDLTGNVRGLDLQALNVLDIPCDGNGNIDLHGTFNLDEMTYNADLCLDNLDWNYNGESIFTELTCLKLDSDGESMSVNYEDEYNNTINFTSPNSVMDFVGGVTGFLDKIDYQRENNDLNVNDLVNELPAFNLDVNLGPNGLLQRFLGRWDVDFREIKGNIANDGDPMSGINTLQGQIEASSLSVGDKAIDSLCFKIDQQDDVIGFTGSMLNKKGTWDEMASVDLEGSATGSTVNLMLNQKNIKNETGYKLGLNADISNSVINVNFLDNPTIAYRNWSVNDSNFVKVDLGNKLIEANLELKSDTSLVKLRTDSSVVGGYRQNILVDIENLVIEEWTNMIPSLSGTTGMLNADMKLYYDGNNLIGKGDVNLFDFVYNGRMRPTDMNVLADLTLDPETSSTRLDATLTMDGSEVAIAYGNLNDNTSSSPLNLGVTMNQFPLEKVSPFIPGRMVMLRGFANGEIFLNGTMDAPIINGKIIGDSAFVTLPRYGSSLKIGNDSIKIDDSTIEFRNFKLFGLNGNPALINGNVDFSSLDNIKMNLDVKGKNIQFFNSEQHRFSELFGKGFIDIDGKLRSSNNLTSINAEAKLLKGSDITYVLQDEINNITSSNATKGMVTFINPNDPQMGGDSTIIVGSSSTASALNILVDVDIESGAKINAFLQPEGRDRVNINGEGMLRYSVDFAGKDDLHGTYVIESGVFRYTPPVLTQKVFNLVEGSSLTWNGDMLNPQLNLQGTNKVRTSVANESGSGSRLVDFDITAILKNTLSNIDLKFDLEAKNDAAIESELQTLTDTQRSQAAINLLLYNSYSGSKTTGNLSTTGALFSFLQSQINSWAANNLKGIDVSFGINQYEGRHETGGRTETSYSYHLSKSLFGDRFKIAIGGEYSTEAKNESSFSENLINDISFEYLLTPTGSRYLRLFRHKGIESVLEGEVTITGISFVMKHKISSLGDLFRWLRKKPSPQVPLPLELPQLNSPTINNNVNDTP